MGLLTHEHGVTYLNCFSGVWVFYFWKGSHMCYFSAYSHSATLIRPHLHPFQKGQLIKQHPHEDKVVLLNSPSIQLWLQRFIPFVIQWENQRE